MIEKENPPFTDVPLAAAGSQQPILMSNHGIEEEKKQVPATNRNLKKAGSHQLGSAINPDIEEEMNDPQVPAMRLAAAAGSHQLISGLDFDPN